MAIDGAEAVQNQTGELRDGSYANYRRMYYGKLFPLADMCRWMSYGNDRSFPGCDRYLRFRSFLTEPESNVNVDPASYAHANNIFTSARGELVFDIVISDYDDVRYCCSGLDVCSECWPLMAVAMKVVDTTLREDFGFEDMLWVYNGRGSVHCWVCDQRARRLSIMDRYAIAEHMDIRKGANYQKMPTLSHPLEDHVARSYVDVLQDFFDNEFVSTQKLFSHEERYEKILDVIPDKSIASQIRLMWKSRMHLSSKGNVLRWVQFQEIRGIYGLAVNIVLHYTYPRLSLEGTKHPDNLLKAPFFINPETGMVSVPIDVEHCEQFDPSAVPTLLNLVEELNMGDPQTNSHDEFEKSIKYFQSSFLQPMLQRL